MEGNVKFQGGVGSQKPKCLKECMKLNWNFQRVGWFKLKNPSWSGGWIFSGTTQCDISFLGY
jgi:hypothetical protein